MAPTRPPTEASSAVPCSVGRLNSFSGAGSQLESEILGLATSRPSRPSNRACPHALHHRPPTSGLRWWGLLRAGRVCEEYRSRQCIVKLRRAESLARASGRLVQQVSTWSSQRAGRTARLHARPARSHAVWRRGSSGAPRADRDIATPARRAREAMARGSGGAMTTAMRTRSGGPAARQTGRRRSIA